jgi:catechol 2,3-dioxygenase-like lactoylglutathione lyase family enzyme
MLILAHFNDDPLPEGKKTYGRIVINTDNADFIAAKAAERGATIRKLPSGGGATIIFFDDPDGYEIELYQAATPSD